MRSGSSRSRRTSKSHPSERPKRIVVFTEGEKTEVSYITHWARSNRRRVNLTVRDHHGVPWSLVEKAVAEIREERGSRPRAQTGTEYWCVFDRDDHNRFSESIQRAEGNGIHVAVSNPCIELWFILHFQDQTGHIESRAAQRESARLLRWNRKALPFEVLEKLQHRFEDAKRRARMLNEKHSGDGREPRSNPSSDIWRLVDRITGL